MSQLRDDLIAARALIDTPEKWTKGSYERDGCYCVAGALRIAIFGGLDDNGPYWDRYRTAKRSLHPSDVILFNDASETTHADMMALFDRAIEAAA